MNLRICLVMMFSVLFFVAVLKAQHEKVQETSWEVPELWQYHDVIYKLWHEAWPEKNIELLSSLLADLKKGYQTLTQTELPGILRDKKEKWTALVGELGHTLELYEQSITDKDSLALLKNAEQLHSIFEKLVRTIRPVLPEVDAFHQELYMLFHYYLPEYNLDKIKQSAVLLKSRMSELSKATLSKRLVNKQKEFELMRQKLADSVEQLNHFLEEQAGEQEIKKAIDEVHINYQNLQAVFD